MIHISLVDLHISTCRALEKVLDDIVSHTPNGEDVTQDALDLQNLILDKFELALYRVLTPMNESTKCGCKNTDILPNAGGKQLLLDLKNPELG